MVDAHEAVRPTGIARTYPNPIGTAARKAKGTNNWFVGNVNGYDARISTINFDFLDTGKKYIATIYADGKGADYKTNPQAYTIRKAAVTNKSKLSQVSASRGGYAISIIAADDSQVKGLKAL